MSSKNTQHTAGDGVIRATAKIIEMELQHSLTPGRVFDIIDNETHAAEMEAFIEKVAAWDFEGRHDTIRIDNIISDMASVISDAQQEAHELLKELRG